MVGPKVGPPEFRPLADVDAGAACALFNRLTRRLPHCFPAGRREFRRFFTTPPRQARDSLRVALFENRELRGFALGQVSDGAGERIANADDGVITGLYARDLPAADALLRCLLHHFRCVGAGRVVGFDPGESIDQVPFFNSGFGACPEQFSPVPQALTRAGFTIASRELHMTGEMGTLAEEPLSSDLLMERKLPPELELRWAARDLTQLHLELNQGPRVVASCIGHGLRTRQSHPSAAGCGYITWLGVEPDYQRRGLARLLLRRMLAEMSSLGLVRVLLTTGSHNWRAQPLYCSLGFVVVGTSASFILDSLV